MVLLNKDILELFGDDNDDHCTVLVALGNDARFSESGSEVGRCESKPCQGSSFAQHLSNLKTHQQVPSLLLPLQYRS